MKIRYSCFMFSWVIQQMFRIRKQMHVNLSSKAFHALRHCAWTPTLSRQKQLQCFHKGFQNVKRFSSLFQETSLIPFLFTYPFHFNSCSPDGLKLAPNSTCAEILVFFFLSSTHPCWVLLLYHNSPCCHHASRNMLRLSHNFMQTYKRNSPVQRQQILWHS